LKCPSCGADNPPETTSCSYCGTHLAVRPSAERSAIFARIRSSAEYADRNLPERVARVPRYTAVQKAIPIVFFAVFIGGSAMMLIVALGMAGVLGFFGVRVGGFGAGFSLVPLVMAIVPAGFVVLGIFLLRAVQKKMHTIDSAPLETIPVIVVDKRTHVSGGSGDSSATTNYFVTCETEDGQRQEYQVWDGTMYGRMAHEDAGILFVRAGYGLDFDCVSV
jgi:hypothetical protein